MAETTRRSIVLKRRPHGEPARRGFRDREDGYRSRQPGEVVTRTIWLSIDPYMRGRLSEAQILRRRRCRSAR